MYLSVKQVPASYFGKVFVLFWGEHVFTFVSLAQMIIVVPCTVQLAATSHSHILSSPSEK